VRKHKELMRFENLTTSLGQKGEDIIQTTELQGLLINLKIQIVINLSNLS